VLKLIRENYSDFGPTLAAEKLRERHDIRLSIETVRNMTALAAEFFSMSDVNRLRILQDVIDHRLITRLAATQPGLRYLTDTVNGYWSAIVI